MSVESTIELLHTYDPLFVKSLLFIFCMFSIVILTKAFKLTGLYIYAVIGIIAANIQVLKATLLPIFDDPIPLGGVVFTSLFLVSDIITELYGKKEANQSIWIGFLSYLIFSIIMIFTVGIRPLETEPGNQAFLDTHNAMYILFTPSIYILISSLIAYATSMWTDIFIFHCLKLAFKERMLWLRTIVSSSIGILVDTVVFSTFAWVIFKIMPISIEAVINTYMMGSIKMRFILIVLSIPFFYLLKAIISKKSISQNHEIYS